MRKFSSQFFVCVGENFTARGKSGMEFYAANENEEYQSHAHTHNVVLNEMS
jgi:hypothetical protein